MAKILDFPIPKFVRTNPPKGHRFSKEVEPAAWNRLRSRIRARVEARCEADYWNRRFHHLPEQVVAVIEPVSSNGSRAAVARRRTAMGC